MKTLQALFLAVAVSSTVTITASPEENASTKEMQRIALLIHHLPEAIQRKTAQRLSDIVTSATSPQEQKQQLERLQIKLEKLLTSRLTHSVHRTAPSPLDPHYQYIEQAANLNIIWQLLAYCSIGCGIYLIGCALKDSDAYSLLMPGNLDALNQRNEKLHTATDAAASLSHALNPQTS